MLKTVLPLLATPFLLSVLLATSVYDVVSIVALMSIAVVLDGSNSLNNSMEVTLLASPPLLALLIAQMLALYVACISTLSLALLALIAAATHLIDPHWWS
jgi:hypothetical protein